MKSIACTQSQLDLLASSKVGDVIYLMIPIVNNTLQELAKDYKTNLNKLIKHHSPLQVGDENINILEVHQDKTFKTKCQINKILEVDIVNPRYI